MTKGSGYSRVHLDQFDAAKGLNRGASKIKEVCWYLVKIVFFLSAIPFPSRFKSFLLCAFGASIGKGLVIKPRVNIHMPWKLILGDFVWIGEEAVVLNFEQLSVGHNVCVSQRVFLCGGNHDYTDPGMTYRNGPITLRDGCWIGACAFIGPGVTIGIDTVVSSGAVVTKSLEDNVIYKGNPAVFVKPRWIEP